MKNLFFALAISIATITTVQISSCAKSCTGGCENGGSCDTKTGSCNCANGYSGTSCQTAANTAFIGNFAGLINCGGGPSQSQSWTQSVQAQNGNPFGIIIVNAVGNGINLATTVTGGIFNIPLQSVAGWSYWGVGSISGNTLNLTIVADTSGYAADTCIFLGND
jgi:hypothetical protein